MLGHGGPLPGPEPEQDLASPRRYQPIVLPRDEPVREGGGLTGWPAHDARARWKQG